MKIMSVLILAACLTASAKGYTQITIKQKDVPLNVVLKEIQKQSGYDIVFTYEAIERFKKVTINIKNSTLEEALTVSLKNTDLSYSIVGKIVVIKQKQENNATNVAAPPIDISGKVTDEDGEPLTGANVRVKGTGKGTTTNDDGLFVLKGVDENAVLEISYVGFQTITLKVNNRTDIVAILKKEVEQLDEVIVKKGYYDEKKILSTGNVSTVRAKEIEKQPVNNPLLALIGRVPGLQITQATGFPGSSVSVQIRGRNSIRNGNNPLYIIDGIPYISENLPGLSSSLVFGNTNMTPSNPFSYINPADIESIDVLKDADATAIYGSRGANGVVLISTKKGRPGQTKVTVNYQSGIGKVAKKLELLNTRQYLDMRYEAFKNDGSTPNANVDYDLTLWDTSRNTDWQKLLIGNTAHYNDAQASISGGNANTQFLFASGYHKETTVFPGDFKDQKASVQFNINNLSADKRFSFSTSGTYLIDNNQLPGTDLTLQAIRLAPNAPSMYNFDGTINWAPSANGVSTWPGGNNPAATILLGFKTKVHNLNSSLSLGYKILKDLQIKTNFGYNNIQTNIVETVPLLRNDPATWATRERRAAFANNRIQSWIIEPQVSYQTELFNGEIKLLAGITVQQNKANGQSLEATGFSSDLVLEDINSATKITSTFSMDALYKYNAVFGRVNYTYRDKYLINLTARRDGTSRFGPDNRFQNFGAAGIGWVFSNERFLQNKFSGLSYGKLRASYGTTGSDQVGDYSFMDLYSSGSSGVPYLGLISLGPIRLYTPDLAWEQTRKLELGIELGFLQDKFIGTASWYRNRSSNQLVEYPLSSVTGFTSVRKNLNALVQNTGWEFELRSVNVQAKNVHWVSSFNLSINRNKLVSAPHEIGNYYLNMIGHSLTSVMVYRYFGVDPITGLYQFADQNGGITFTPNSQTDMYFIDLATKFFGGLSNSISYQNLQLDFLFQFASRPFAQIYQYNYIPGVFNGFSGSNQPIIVLERWKVPGDVKNIQRFSQNGSTLNAYNYAQFSDQNYRDASYVRLKNASLSWQLPSRLKEKLNFQNAKLYVQGQNLFTITKLQALDPESGSSNLPPLRVITFGIQISL